MPGNIIVYMYRLRIVRSQKDPRCVVLLMHVLHALLYRDFESCVCNCYLAVI